MSTLRGESVPSELTKQTRVWPYEEQPPAGDPLADTCFCGEPLTQGNWCGCAEGLYRLTDERQNGKPAPEQTIDEALGEIVREGLDVNDPAVIKEWGDWRQQHDAAGLDTEYADRREQPDRDDECDQGPDEVGGERQWSREARLDDQDFGTDADIGQLAGTQEWLAHKNAMSRIFSVE